VVSIGTLSLGLAIGPCNVVSEKIETAQVTFKASIDLAPEQPHRPHFELYRDHAVGRAAVAAHTTTSSGQFRLFDCDGIDHYLS
jgi:hypothetical protein